MNKRNGFGSKYVKVTSHKIEAEAHTAGGKI
jgi:hypothetical protein